jgi:membrane associated rhomboid family serine protease
MQSRSAVRTRVPLAVFALVAVNVAVFLLEAAFPDQRTREAFIDGYALIPFDLTHGVQLDPPAPPTALTLVTSQFLHGSVLHVAVNMLVLLAFGPEIESEAGHLRFLGFYLVCGVLGNLAEVAVLRDSHVPGIGASGAIAGVLGAYILRFPTKPVLTFPAYVLIGLWALTQFAHGFGTLSTRVLSEAGGGTAYFAHIGGFLAGVFISAVGLAARHSGRGLPRLSKRGVPSRGGGKQGLQKADRSTLADDAN